MRLPLLAGLVLLGCSGNKQPDSEPQKATLILQDGETLVGSIVSQEGDVIGFIDKKGIYRGIPAKEVLFVTPGEHAAQASPTAAASVPESESGALEKFKPPASGVLAISAGQPISVTPSQTIDTELMFPHQVLTGELTTDIPARPVNIPAGATANLEVLEMVPRDASKIVFGLAGFNIKGHLYKVTGGISARLGSFSAPGGPRPRISNGTVLSWRLTQSLVLKETK